MSTNKLKANEVIKKIATENSGSAKIILQDIIKDLDSWDISSVLMGTYEWVYKFNSSHLRSMLPPLEKIPIFNLKNPDDHREAQVAILTKEFIKHRSEARSRGITHKLELNEFQKLVLNRCFYCGGLPTKKRENRGFTILLNGIDRSDSNNGYTNKNCESCCSKCNSAKGNKSQRLFLEIAKDKAIYGTPTDLQFYKHILEYQALKKGNRIEVSVPELDDLKTPSSAIRNNSGAMFPLNVETPTPYLRSNLRGKDPSIEDLQKAVENL